MNSDQRWTILEQFFHGVPESELHHVLHVMQDVANQASHTAELLKHWQMSREKLVERSIDLDELLGHCDMLLKATVDAWGTDESKYPAPAEVAEALGNLFTMTCVIEDAHDELEEMPDNGHPVQPAGGPIRMRRNGRRRGR